MCLCLCLSQHTRSQGSCENDFDMFSDDGSITDSGRGGSEQGEHLNTSLRPSDIPSLSRLQPPTLIEETDDDRLIASPSVFQALETQSKCKPI